jgi:hypothetical protein
MMAAVLATGETVLRNAAREPEVSDLAGSARSRWARRSKARAHPSIRIQGVEAAARGRARHHSRPHRGRHVSDRRGDHRRRCRHHGVRAGAHWRACRPSCNRPGRM